MSPRTDPCTSLQLILRSRRSPPSQISTLNHTPTPSDVWPYFTVGNCRRCLEARERGNPNLDEPARLINPGEKPWIMNPRFRNATDIAILAVEWRWRVEEYERDTRGSQSLLERDKRERVHEMRRKQRRLRRDADWATYQNCLIPVGRILPQILNLTQETQDYRALQVALPSPGALCSIFPGGIDMPADGERDANARAMLCGHVMHRKCLAQALMHTRACPDCKNSVNFVLKSSFDDPKHRWDEEKKKGIQVNGYVDFKAGLEGRNFLEPYGKDNRWGDDA